MRAQLKSKASNLQRSLLKGGEALPDQCRPHPGGWLGEMDRPGQSDGPLPPRQGEELGVDGEGSTGVKAPHLMSPRSQELPRHTLQAAVRHPELRQATEDLKGEPVRPLLALMPHQLRTRARMDKQTRGQAALPLGNAATVSEAQGCLQNLPIMTDVISSHKQDICLRDCCFQGQAPSWVF